jgi:hypothetical protein
MRRAAMAFAAITLAAFPAVARPLPATPEQKEAAFRAYTECRLARIDALDDGVSDALTIGIVVASACQNERENIAAVLTQDQKRDRVRVGVLERMNARAGSEAAALVLIRRKQKVSEGKTE